MSCVYLAACHGRAWLWGTVIHESGRYTLLETTFYASHCLGHVPVPANPAEGHGRFGRDRQHHWRTAYASAKEAESHLRPLVSAGAVHGLGVTKALESFDQARAMTWRLLHPLSASSRPTLAPSLSPAAVAVTCRCRCHLPLSQRPDFARDGRLSLPYLLASHAFEHVLDSLFFALLTLLLAWGYGVPSRLSRFRLQG